MRRDYVTDDREKVDFDAFARDYGPALRRRFAANAVRAGLDVDDVVQEVLARTFAYCQQMRDADEVFRYALTVGWHLRSEWGTRAQRESACADLSVYDAAPCPDTADVVVARHRADALHHALGALPRRQRLVLAAQAAGWRGSEIAEELGVPRSTVKSLTQRAYAKLREDLAHLRVGAVTLVVLTRRAARSVAPVAPGMASVLVAGVAAWSLGVVSGAAVPGAESTVRAGAVPASTVTVVAVPEAREGHLRDRHAVPSLSTSADESGTTTKGTAKRSPQQFRSPGVPDGNVCVGDQCVLPAPPAGDWICVNTDTPVCTTQTVMTVCSEVPDNELVTCQRGEDDDYLVSRPSELPDQL